MEGTKKEMPAKQENNVERNPVKEYNRKRHVPAVKMLTTYSAINGHTIHKI